MTTRFFATLSLIIGLGACGQDPDVSVFYPDEEPAGPEVVEPALPAEPPPCGAGFDFAPELAEVGAAAVERWRAATGCDIRAEAGGIPVLAWGFLFLEEMPDGTTRAHDSNPQLKFREVCGGTFWGQGSHIVVAIRNESCPLDQTVVHELGHRLSSRVGHPESGVLAQTNEPGRTPLIDDSTLTWVCENLHCASFSPEG